MTTTMQNRPEPEDAVAILRRLEPVLRDVLSEQKRLAEEQKRVVLELQYMATEQRRQGEEQRRQAEEQRRHVEILAEIRGKISQIPTSWQMMVAIVAIVFATIGGLRVGTMSF